MLLWLIVQLIMIQLILVGLMDAYWITSTLWNDLTLITNGRFSWFSEYLEQPGVSWKCPAGWRWPHAGCGPLRGWIPWSVPRTGALFFYSITCYLWVALLCDTFFSFDGWRSLCLHYRTDADCNCKGMQIQILIFLWAIIIHVLNDINVRLLEICCCQIH